MEELNTINVRRETADKMHLLKRQGRFRNMDELISKLIKEYERLVKDK